MQEDDRSSIYRTLDDLLRGTQTPEGLPPLSLESEGLRLQVPVIIHDMSDLSSMGLELARKSEAWTTEKWFFKMFLRHVLHMNMNMSMAWHVLNKFHEHEHKHGMACSCVAQVPSSCGTSAFFLWHKCLLLVCVLKDYLQLQHEHHLCSHHLYKYFSGLQHWSIVLQYCTRVRPLLNRCCNVHQMGHRRRRLRAEFQRLLQWTEMRQRCEANRDSRQTELQA